MRDEFLLGNFYGFCLTSIFGLAFAWSVNILGHELAVQRELEGTTLNGFALHFGASLFVCALAISIISKLVSRSAWKERSLFSVRQAFELVKSNVTFAELLAAETSSIASLISSASLGRFGPCISIGAITGVYAGEKFSFSQDDISALSRFCAAAFAALTMSTPLAVIVFIYETSKDFLTSRLNQSLLFIFVSCGFALGQACGVGLQYSKSSAWSSMDQTLEAINEPSLNSFHTPLDFILIFGLAASCVLVAKLFEQMFALTMFCRKALHPRLSFRNAQLVPFVGSLLLLCIYFFIPSVSSTSDRLVRRSVLGAVLSKPLILMQIVCKIAATAMSIATGFQGGAVGPCVVLGCCIASFWLSVFDELGLVTSLESRSIAATGVACMISAVLKLPLFGVVFSCEIFDAYQGVLFTLFGVAISFPLSTPYSEAIVFRDGSQERNLRSLPRSDYPSSANTPVETI